MKLDHWKILNTYSYIALGSQEYRGNTKLAGHKFIELWNKRYADEDTEEKIGEGKKNIIVAAYEGMVYHTWRARNAKSLGRLD